MLFRSSSVLQTGDFDFYTFSDYIIIASNNWNLDLSKQIQSMSLIGVEINDFFKFERKMSFDFSSLVNDINILQKYILLDKNIDISSFSTRLSYAFLPPNVYYLEEYGLPRTISKKVSRSKIINLENPEIKLSEIILDFISIGKEKLLNTIELESFDKFIIDYFYDGIIKK